MLLIRFIKLISLGHQLYCHAKCINTLPDVQIQKSHSLQRKVYIPFEFVLLNIYMFLAKLLEILYIDMDPVVRHYLLTDVIHFYQIL